MNRQFRHRPFPAGNPLANVLVVIVGAAVISLSLALGLIVFVGIAGFVMVMSLVMSARTWWLTRNMGAGRPADAGNRAPPPGQRQIIEGEYHEVGNPDKSHDDL